MEQDSDIQSKTSKALIDKLEKENHLTTEEYAFLIENQTETIASYAAEKAVKAREKIYGKSIYVRALIEISNICKNNCFYCGIRVENKSCRRYRLSADEIFDCASEAYKLGFRTFVLQGGEDAFFNDDFLCNLVEKLKINFSDAAVTLSLGERTKDSYKRLFDAGTDRYLLRHETADREHYQKLHPKEMSFDNRMECIQNLKEIGYQVGIGFMVGSPFQTDLLIAKDLKFIETFKPAMCGIGPFIAHHATPFANKSNGTVAKTTFLLSLIRLIRPNILLPATTALGSVMNEGREKGILSGANIIMPNMTPKKNRKDYEIYDNKISTGLESAQNIQELIDSIAKTKCMIDFSKGDAKYLNG
ncbi:MAG: [FeFe] hydrogenase H-cluster radical SAM maturase HydE [Treponema sp.]|nr:[FeFe] hydrogenase H-cluster radical SAM maturase HydE [Treponema sp.]